jgi:hypothetical protein
MKKSMLNAVVLFQISCGVFQDIISFCAVRCDKLDVLLKEIGYSIVIEVYHIMMKKYINFIFSNPTLLLPIEIAWFCMCSAYTKAINKLFE